MALKGERKLLSWIWAAFLVLSFVCGAATGRLGQVTAAMAEGAGQAVALLVSITGLMCFWSGMMEVISRAGLAGAIARLLRPVLRALFGEASRDAQAMEAVSANVTANLLGLSNASTPIGLRAAERLYAVCGGRGAPDAVLTLVTLNSASIQLIPSTVAAVRASLGAAAPFDIMPAVWGASVVSVLAVVFAGRVLRPVFPDTAREMEKYSRK